MKSYAAIFQAFLKRYVTDENIAKLDTEVQNPAQGLMALGGFAQELHANTQRCGSVWNEMSIKVEFVEAVINPFCMTLRERRAEHQQAFLENMAQSAEQLLALEERSQQKHTIKAEQSRFRNASRNVKTCRGR